MKTEVKKKKKKWESYSTSTVLMLGRITHEAASILGYVYKSSSTGNRAIPMVGRWVQIMLLVTSWVPASLLSLSNLPVAKDWIMGFVVVFEQVSLFAILNH